MKLPHFNCGVLERKVLVKCVQIILNSEEKCLLGHKSVPTQISKTKKKKKVPKICSNLKKKKTKMSIFKQQNNLQCRLSSASSFDSSKRLYVSQSCRMTDPWGGARGGLMFTSHTWIFSTYRFTWVNNVKSSDAPHSALLHNFTPSSPPLYLHP